MGKRLILVLALSVVIGVIVGFTAGRLPGAGAFAAAALIGAVIVVLRRNQQDLRELEAGLVPDEVDDALGEPHPPHHERGGSALEQP